ncbi:hypothetical protein LNJ03_07375 [Tenacibaculum dicentrarchi]|nr:hypothetical protein [Tenacibaculum dicentrarchi]
MSYKFYEDDDDSINLKYSVGDEIINFGEIENLTLTMVFDYLSLDKTKLCFNNPKITADDFTKLFEFKQRVSKIKINYFIEDSNTKREYHFHSIDLYKKKFLLEPLKKLLNYNKFIEVYKLPTIYQLGVYTNNETMKAPRIIGFFGKNACFHLIWFDYEHSIYPNKT